ncbi:MAG TPA: mobilization protein [Steroidobacteraceae bacterium]|nr:mobilization protein [Steroidobacteraceae bacterium]
MATPLTERIESLEQRLKKLKTQQQRQEARKRSLDSRRSRREDTRRKILIGAIVLAKIDQGVFERATLMSWLDQALTRTDDRALFALGAQSTSNG